MKNNVKSVFLVIIFALVMLLNAEFIKMNNYFAYAKNDVKTSAKAMLVMDVNSGRVLYSKNDNEKLPMASTTKIITAIVAIENNDDLERLVEIDDEMTGIEGTSIYLKKGEHLTIRELLYGLMLRSGNDSAIAIAKATSGSVDAFMDLANKFCKNIGACDTNLTNPHGLPDDNHYTTARDLALISSYAMKNVEFAKIVNTKQKTIQNELNSSKKRVLNNKNKLLKNMEIANGIKTGYTKKAGRCFVGSATYNDMTLVCVLLNCNPMFEECKMLLENAFSEYKNIELVKADEVVGELKVENGIKDTVKITAGTGAIVPLKVSEVDDVNIVYDVPACISDPFSAGDVVGKFDIYVSNHLIFSGKIYIIEDVYIKEPSVGNEIIKDFVHLD